MNQLRIRRRIPHEVYSEELVKYVREDLIRQILLRATTDMRLGIWYKIKYEESQEKSFEDDVELIINLEYGTIPERAVVYRSPESQFLPPVKSFKQKLKNCVKYLRDKTGDSMETVSINGKEYIQSNGNIAQDH